MPIYNRLSVRASVRVFVALAVFNAALLGLLGFWQSMQNRAVTEALHADVDLVRAAGHADMMHDALRATVYRALHGSSHASAEERKAIEAEAAEFRQEFAKAVATFDRLAGDAGLADALQRAKPLIERYQQAAAGIVGAAFDDPARAQAALPAFGADFEALAQALEGLSDGVERHAAQSLERRDQVHVQVQTATGVAIALTVLAVALFGMQFGRTLLDRLGAEPQQLRDLAHRIAGGQLHARLDGQAASGSVAAAMSTMCERLRATVTTIREGADGVATGSAQIDGGNRELSARTERQVGRLQQAAASMAQISGSAGHAAEHASVASQLAEQTSTLARRGGESVQRVVSTMDEIQSASHRIAQIITVIDGIAFQTNILALNAAVEAARAGEQGRGFAVVASEVRSLAQRSAGAAREIKSLIDDSVQRVEQGHATVREAGATMGEVVDGVRRVTELIGGIHQASGEQNRGVAVISQSLSGLDSDAQSNAALVEETSAAATALRDQALRLAQAVAVFELAAS